MHIIFEYKGQQSVLQSAIQSNILVGKIFNFLFFLTTWQYHDFFLQGMMLQAPVYFSAWLLFEVLL